jgi:hypothetical protein
MEPYVSYIALARFAAMYKVLRSNTMQKWNDLFTKHYRVSWGLRASEEYLI